MKRPYLVTAIAVSVLLAWSSAILYAQRGSQSTQPTPLSPTHLVQRFQLVTGEYETYVVSEPNGAVNPTTTKGIFRIDTETGRVWILHEVFRPSSGLLREWVDVGQDISSQVKSM